MTQDSLLSQLNWDRYFLNIVTIVASKSKDPATKVGCVIVGEDHQILSTGFNGFPRGVVDRAGRYSHRPTKYQYIEHADRNAIYNAARTGIALKGSTMYLPWHPCHECARAIIQSGIICVVIRGFPPSEEVINRWKESWNIASNMLSETGVIIRFIHLEDN